MIELSKKKFHKRSLANACRAANHDIELLVLNPSEASLHAVDVLRDRCLI
jgi:hypothetical protein